MRRKRPESRVLPSLCISKPTGHRWAGWLPPEPGMLNHEKPSDDLDCAGSNGRGRSVAVALVPATGSRPGPQSQAEPAPTVSAFDRPEGASEFRPSYHITPGKNWMNDPQRPILLDGVWHYYYLYNAGYPKENGTEWYHLTSTDLVHWKEEGVAISQVQKRAGRHRDRKRRGGPRQFGRLRQGSRHRGHDAAGPGHPAPILVLFHRQRILIHRVCAESGHGKSWRTGLAGP